MEFDYLVSKYHFGEICKELKVINLNIVVHHVCC